mmetsp:Transcript_73925/g.154065  ORF Transcript_73925/g.154065 Transcript_73925/m.154065 type:complete len:1560 (-) Transcript_73925:95-4774(-)
MVVGTIAGMTFERSLSLKGNNLDEQGLDVEARKSMAGSLPQEYHDALMDDEYMERMVVAVQKLNNKRRMAFDRFVKMNRVIFIALIIQAIFGVFLALWMTVMQPKYNFETSVDLEDADMVFMLEASEHRGSEKDRKEQANMIKQVSEALFDAMKEERKTQLDKAIEEILNLKESKATWLQKIWRPKANPKDEGQRKDAMKSITQSRGYLRIATGLFNTDLYKSFDVVIENDKVSTSPVPEAAMIRPLTYSYEKAAASLSTLSEKESEAKFNSLGHWHDAMASCYHLIEDATERGRQMFSDAEGPNKRMATRCYQETPKEGEAPCVDLKDQQACSRAARYCTWSESESKCWDKRPLCRKQFCVIVGDSDTMCRRKSAGTQAIHPSAENTEITNTDDLFDGLFSDDLLTEEQKKAKEELAGTGSTLEWAQEMEDCSNFYAKHMSQKEGFGQRTGEDQKGGLWDVNLMNSVPDITLIMLFLIKGEAEAQIRLHNPTFRDFVINPNGLGCGWSKKTSEKFGGFEEVEIDPECLRFVMKDNIPEMTKDAQRMTRLLKNEVTTQQSPNADQDFKYLFFLILPLNLVFYLSWTWLIRWYTQTQTAMDKAMGKKKKMIKVTKMLVEKEEESYGNAMGDLELAEVEKLKQPIEYGSNLTVRARLKGGYLKNNKANRCADGSGTAFEQAAGWIFEPIDGSGMNNYPIESGVPFRIKNNFGQYLKVDENGSSFQDDPDNTGAGATEFCIEPFSTVPRDEADDKEDRVHLGDICLVRCNATGKFLKVSKEGKVDATGERTNAECQMVIDRGGQPMQSGAIITLAAEGAAGQLMHCTPKGEVVVGEGNPEDYQGSYDDWLYWLLEKKVTIDSPEATTESAASSSKDETAAEVEIGKGGGDDDDIPDDTKEDMGEDKSFDFEDEAGDDEKAADSGAAGSSGGGGITGAQVVAKKTSTVADPRKNEDVLHEGDIVTLKAFNGQLMEVGANGEITAGRGLLGAAGSSTQPVVSREFVVHKMGVSNITRHNNTIRRGEKICLKPVRSDVDKKNNDYVKVNENEDGVFAGGTIYDKEIGFIIEGTTITPLVEPLSNALERGDVDIAFCSLWEKSNVQHCEAMSAAWCKDDELANIKGIVVVASGGTYSVPKAQGQNSSDWVAVVDDGVDIFKASKQAKAQGATGIIVRCDNPCSLDRLMLGADETKEVPCLPCIFASKDNAEALNDRGLTLNGVTFRKKYVTDVMRAIGKAPITKGKKANTDVFNAAAVAMLEREKELAIWKEEEAERQRQEELRKLEEEEGGGDQFKWKVNTNTHYLWGGGGKMKVNYGNKAPPSAHKHEKIGADGKVQGVDAGTLRHTVKRPSLAAKKKKVRVSVTAIDAEDFKDRKMGGDRDGGGGAGGLFGDLSEVLTAEEASAQPMEELSEESDFRIEYQFDEIMVDVDAKLEDVEEEQEFFDDSGAEVQQLGVPKKKFWVVAVGLGCSTLFLMIILIIVLCKKKPEKVHLSDKEQMQEFDGVDEGAALWTTLSSYNPAMDTQAIYRQLGLSFDAYEAAMEAQGLRGQPAKPLSEVSEDVFQ